MGTEQRATATATLTDTVHATVMHASAPLAVAYPRVNAVELVAAATTDPKSFFILTVRTNAPDSAKWAQAFEEMAEQLRGRASADPLDWPLPCDVTVGHGTMAKGVSLRTLVLRMKSLYEMATGTNADDVAARSPDERAKRLQSFLEQTEAGKTAQGDLPERLMAAARKESLDWEDRFAIGQAVARLQDTAQPSRWRPCPIGMPDEGPVILLMQCGQEVPFTVQRDPAIMHGARPIIGLPPTATHWRAAP